MKETYYSPENITEQAKALLHCTHRSRRRNDFAVPRSALLVLDMQRFFLEESSHAFIPSAPAILPNIERLVQVFAARRMPVFFTRHVNTAENAAQMAVWWQEIIQENHPMSELYPGLPVSSAEVIKKSQYDAFYKTTLEDRLHDQQVRQVVICGVMAHLCCETTARSAFMRGFQVFFTVDGTATYNLDFHCSTLLNLSHGFAVPVLVDELLVRFREAQKDA